MDLAKLQPIYNACNPDESLRPDDPRNVDFDALYQGDEALRGGPWVRRMARQIELSGATPVCKLFTGLRGSGKSTELLRLAARLREPGGPHLLPVLIDAEEMLDLSAEVDVPDILATLVFGTERELLRAESRDPDDALKDGYLRRFSSWLLRTDVSLKEAELGGGDLGHLVLEMKTRETVRQRVRAIIGAHMTTFLREVRQELTLLNDRAKKLGFKGVVIIYDSLEKLQGISTTWPDVLQSAERVFANDAPYLQLPVHVLYTIPPAVALRLRVDVHYLPMIKLHDRGGRRFAPGYTAAREMIRQRVPDLVLNELLGAKQREVHLERLIEWSGGYPREIVRMLQSFLEIEDNITSAREFERVLTRAGDAYRRVVLASGALDWLTRVVSEQALRLENDADRESADRMLAASVVLRYLNDTEWFELHPAVYEIPQLKSRRAEALEEKRQREP
jgi:hypothetical protein